MMKLETVHLVITNLTPLHIGTGELLLEGADYAVAQQGENKREALLIDVDRALMTLTDDEIKDARNGRIAAALGESRRMSVLRDRCPIRGRGNVNEVRAMMRLPDGRPYIPGSTVKGSIRTALLAAAVQADAGLLREVPGDARSAERAAGRLEERAFAAGLAPDRGPQFANKDVNRAVRVSDFVPVDRVAAAFMDMSAYRIEGERDGATRIPIWCEVIQPGMEFRGAITVEMDSPLWGSMEQQQRDRLSALLDTWGQWGKRLASAESGAWKASNTGISEILGDIARRRECVAAIGWGTGWRAKTIGLLLSGQQISEVAERYRQSRWKGRDFPERFPATRKLAATISGLVPPGWVSVRAVPPRDGP